MTRYSPPRPPPPPKTRVQQEIDDSIKTIVNTCIDQARNQCALIAQNQAAGEWVEAFYKNVTCSICNQTPENYTGINEDISPAESNKYFDKPPNPDHERWIVCPTQVGVAFCPACLTSSVFQAVGPTSSDFVHLETKYEPTSLRSDPIYSKNAYPLALEKAIPLVEQHNDKWKRSTQKQLSLKKVHQAIREQIRWSIGSENILNDREIKALANNNTPPDLTYYTQVYKAAQAVIDAVEIENDTKLPPQLLHSPPPARFSPTHSPFSSPNTPPYSPATPAASAKKKRPIGSGIKTNNNEKENENVNKAAKLA